MNSQKTDTIEKRHNNTSPSPFQSKFEYFDANIESEIDDLEFIYSLPKSGYSNYDFLLKNGEKYSKKVDSEYVEVLLKGNLRSLFKNVNNTSLRIDDFVVVEGEYGLDVGRVVDLNDKTDVKSNLCMKQNVDIYKLLRVPDINELKVFNKKLKDEYEVLQKTRELVVKYGFEMKITEAIWQFDRQRLTIYFTAPQRIDFRELVKDLARLFKARIELRQISSREETKRLGNFVGPCGRELCCTTFMNSFGHVTLEHAKVQQLSNNISKLSGNCGRLKCCIKFEYDTYASAIEKYPPIGSVIECNGSSLKIIKIDIFNAKITTYNDVQSQYLQHTSLELSELIKKGRLILADTRSDSRRFDNFDAELRALLD
jgi:cell fate regulator YaaT (PSP1 superfamily)